MFSCLIIHLNTWIQNRKQFFEQIFQFCGKTEHIVKGALMHAEKHFWRSVYILEEVPLYIDDDDRDLQLRQYWAFHAIVAYKAATAVANVFTMEDIRRKILISICLDLGSEEIRQVSLTTTGHGLMNLSFPIFLLTKQFVLLHKI
jgi:hypothetical protein